MVLKRPAMPTPMTLFHSIMRLAKLAVQVEHISLEVLGCDERHTAQVGEAASAQ